jgi:hypothetical protein
MLICDWAEQRRIVPSPLVGEDRERGTTSTAFVAYLTADGCGSFGS